jgi:Amt family ammonium transporter
MFHRVATFRKAKPGGHGDGHDAGLATITPASGFVGPLGAIVIGVVSGSVCYISRPDR